MTDLDDRRSQAEDGGVVVVPEVVELHPHPAKDLVEVVVVPGHQLRRRRPPLLGVDDDGRPVGVGAADEVGGLSHLLQPPDEYVGGDVGPEVADVAGAVGVGQSAGYEYGRFGWSKSEHLTDLFPNFLTYVSHIEKKLALASGLSPSRR